MVTAATPRSLIRNMLHAVGGSGVFQLCQFAVIVLIAKFASAATLGQYNAALATVSPIILACALELRGAFVSDVGGQFTFGTYETLRRWSMGLAAVVIAGIAAWIAWHGATGEALLILAAVAAGRILFSMSEGRWGVFQRLERLDWLAGANSWRGLALLLPMVLVLPIWLHLSNRASAADAQTAAGWAVATALLITAALWGLIDVVYDRPRVAQAAGLDRGWTADAVRRLARQTLPLGIVALIITLCDSYPRLLVARVPDGETQLGYFAALSAIPLGANLIMIQVASAAANRFSQHYQAEPVRFLKLLGSLALIALALGLGLVLLNTFLGRTLLKMLYRPEYGAYKQELLIVTWASCLMLFTSVFGIATTQMRLFAAQVPIHLAVLATTIIAAQALVPANPLRGAAWTALLRAAAQFLLYGGCVAYGLATRARRVPAPPPAVNDGNAASR